MVQSTIVPQPVPMIDPLQFLNVPEATIALDTFMPRRRSSWRGAGPGAVPIVPSRHQKERVSLALLEWVKHELLRGVVPDNTTDLGAVHHCAKAEDVSRVSMNCWQAASAFATQTLAELGCMCRRDSPTGMSATTGKQPGPLRVVFSGGSPAASSRAASHS